MDPRTALVIATLMMLLNGGVLGLMHGGLSRDVQPSAADWRIGTLLAAGGSLLLAAQEGFPPAFILPVGNACLFIAMALYWRSVRRFDGHADSPWIFLPVLAGTAGIFWFAAISPNLGIRVLIASIAWAISLLAAAASLIRGSRLHAAVSRNVLAGIMLIVALFMLARTLYFLLNVQVYANTNAAPVTSIIDTGNWVNAVTPLLVAILPVIGTTAFLMMCSERILGQWERAASIDYLTGLPNRLTINGTGAARFNAAHRNGANLAVAIIDVDHFKSINDRFGHESGDLALKHLANLLAEHCRGPNMVGRLGGEEFVALLEDADLSQAMAAAERLRNAIAQSPLPLDGKPLPMTVSIGVSAIRAEDNEFEDLLRRADKALYAAKSAGRNRVDVALDAG